MLQINQVSVDYGSVHALSSVSLKVAPGEVVALLGSNGAGKSTLMRAVIGLVPTSAGSVIFDGTPLDQLAAEARVALGIATVPEGRGMLPRMTVFENLQMGAFLLKGDRLDEDLERVFELFPILKQRIGQAAGTLSGGEQQMLALARALMLRPKLILMDEPSMGLAPVIVERVFSTIEAINRMGTTILLVEQNARMALSVAHRFYVLRTGEIVLEGMVENGQLISAAGGRSPQILSDEQLEAAYLEGS